MSNDSKKDSNTNDNALDALWNEWDSINNMGLDDKSDEGRSLRVSIKEYIEENDLDIAIIRSKTNKDLLDEIENALNGADEDIKNDEDDTSLPAQMDEDDENDAPASDPTPQKERNDDTNEPAARPERRAARPERRRR